MKSLILAAALLLSVSMAHATYCKDGSLIASHPNGDCSKPIPTPKPAPLPTGNASSSTSGATANQAQNAAASSKASAAAAAVSKSAADSNSSSGASATGGNATGGSNSLGSVGNDNSSTSFRALALSLPSPVFTPPMPLASCPQANVEQEAHAVGWNFYSQAHGSVNTDNCTAIIVYNAMLEQCQYESAQYVLDALMVKVIPGFKGKSQSGLNLTPQQCHDLKAPPVAVVASTSVSGPDYHIVDAPICPPAAPIAAKSKPKPKGKKVAAVITECRGS